MPRQVSRTASLPETFARMLHQSGGLVLVLAMVTAISMENGGSWAFEGRPEVLFRGRLPQRVGQRNLIDLVSCLIGDEYDQRDRFRERKVYLTLHHTVTGTNTHE